ncbi:MAG: alanine racemase [Burkholderiaceae bacterium]
MPRPILATIDLGALRHNVARAREQARGRFVWAVVKANAYGHGLERALRAFSEADGLALLDLDEARRAREEGWRKPILLLEGCFEPDDLAVCSDLDLTTVVHCGEQLAMVEHHRPSRPISVHLKLNTGMNRLGFRPPGAARAYERLRAMKTIRDLTLMMHFANADRVRGASGPVAALEQSEEFARMTAGWPEPRSLANSAALFLLPEIGGDSVRPGISLYGGATDESHSAASLGLKAGMVLTSQIIGVQSVDRGAAVGYGSRFVARRPTRIGVVACGYADGYPRHAPDGTPVVVGDRRVPLAGRVSMDMITVDLTDAPQAGVGTPVELWGARLPIDEVAHAAETVGYELMCALARRVPVVEVA